MAPHHIAAHSERHISSFESVAVRGTRRSLLHVLDFVMGYVAGQRVAARAHAYSRTALANSALQSGAEVDQVNERVDRLLLVVDAMWSLLRESGWTDEQLKQRIEELDAADGVMDGRRTAKARRCTKCEAMVAADRITCAFCGAEMPSAPGALDAI